MWTINSQTNLAKNNKKKEEFIQLHVVVLIRIHFKKLYLSKIYAFTQYVSL